VAEERKDDWSGRTLLGVGPPVDPRRAAPTLEARPDKPARDEAPIMPVIGALLAQRFQLEVVLGRGGSGVVYRAFDRVMGEAVAVKVLYPERAANDGWIRRLVREVRVARSIRHPNVCRIFEIAQTDGYWFVTMELGVGTLGDELRAYEGTSTPVGPLRSWRKRRDDARAVCDGLAAIHASGISHRDVTPQNVLRLADGRLVVSDFGLALLDGETTAFLAATPDYAPPEVLSGASASQRSDVWQLGLVLHEIVFGQRPRWEDVGEHRVLQRPIGIDAATPVDELMRVLVSCLRTDPARRPATAVAIAQALEALSGGRRTTAATPKLRRWTPRAGVAAAVVVLALVAAARVPAFLRRRTVAAAPAAPAPLVPVAPPPLAASPAAVGAPIVAAVTRIRIHIESRPTRARVVDAETGAAWGMTPLDAERDADAGAVRLRVVKVGFEPADLTIDGDRSVSDFIGLVPRAPTDEPVGDETRITDSELIPPSAPIERHVRATKRSRAERPPWAPGKL